jgi:3-hydroxyacyl-CoA dehydrogenase
MPAPITIENRPITVIGGGTLGRRIALMFADRGGVVPIPQIRAAASEFISKRESLMVHATVELLQRYVSAGQLVRKAGQGFYD